MGVKNLNLVLGELDAIPRGMQSIFWDSMREAGEVVAKELAAKAPHKSGELSKSFSVWQSKRISRRYRAVIFRIGLRTEKNKYPNFYATLAKGRKAHERKGRPVKGSKASHPGWRLPGEDAAAIAHTLHLSRMIFEGKINNIDKIIGRGKRR